MPDKKAFTLIELLIVIGIIAILASGVIVAINPGQQFAQARDATRELHINTLQTVLLSYQTANQGNLSGLSLPAEPTEVCNTNEVSSGDCGSLIDLSTLTTDGYINSLPIDPQGGVDANGTGYFIAEGSIILVADKAETRFIGIGTTEAEYDGGGEESTFSCAEEGQGEHTVDGDTIYCDASDNMWSPTLDLPADGSNDATYVWSDNCHGTTTGCDSSTDGEANTTCMLSACDDSGTNAAEQCDNLNYAGETDWYLPAINTVESLYDECVSNQDGVSDGDECLPEYDQNAQKYNYWSSTESSDTSAKIMNFTVDAIGGNDKDLNDSIRCIRR